MIEIIQLQNNKQIPESIHLKILGDFFREILIEITKIIDFK